LAPPLRLAVYTDYAYHRVGSDVYSERAFSLFIERLAANVERLVVIGRLDPEPGRARYRLGEGVEFVPLPFYRSLAEPLQAIRGMAGAPLRFWRAMEAVDAVWILGPHPLALPFAAIAALRGRRIFLGVRQDFPAYIAARRGSRWIRLAAAMLERSFRLLGRACPVVVVGPQIAHNYRRSRSLLQIAVSLVDDADIVSAEAAAKRSYEGDLEILSVGRLDVEKNPLILAEVLGLLRDGDPRWRLAVCGEGPMADDLQRRLQELGLAESSELLGYVALDKGLLERYRESHVFFHASWTEGLPQVLFEAFAAGLPVVATDVGGIREALGEAVSLVPAGDPEAAERALQRLVSDRTERERLIAAGFACVRRSTMTMEAGRTASFLRDGLD
jgi:glycosyltransferase involved in cell wall biosynthesis